LVTSYPSSVGHDLNNIIVYSIWYLLYLASFLSP
jgi:hypothetical protein